MTKEGDLRDYHCHSQASDGVLTPEDVVTRAVERGITELALTDHDTVAGLRRAAAAAEAHGMRLVPGIELSASWAGVCVHIVGLDIDPHNAALHEGIRIIAGIRATRAATIGARLARLGHPSCLDLALQLAGEGMVTRMHFARALVQLGAVVDERAAFERYLANGKPAYTRTEWPALDDALAWISDAGGIAVLAHPSRYGLTATRMAVLLEAFCNGGGRGIEVVCGNSSPADIEQGARWARRFGLLASVGSDFHTPDYPWLELGRLQALPGDLIPVWHHWEPPHPATQH